MTKTRILDVCSIQRFNDFKVEKLYLLLNQSLRVLNFIRDFLPLDPPLSFELL